MLNLKRSLFLPILVAMVLAGCATNGGNPADDGTGGTPATGTGEVPTDVTTTQARDQLAHAVADMPDKFGMDFVVRSSAGKDLMTAKGTFDNATGTSYFEMRADPSVFNQSGGEAGGMGEAAAAMFANGFAMYTTPAGTVLLFNGTAFAMPPANESSTGGFATDQGAFGDVTDPESMLGALGEADVNVTNVKGVLFKGKPALEIDVRHEDDEGRQVESTVTVYTQTNRVAHIESVLPTGAGSSGQDPFAGATFVGDFLYGDEASLQVSEAARRAHGLSYKSDQNPFSFGSERPEAITWTFQVDGDVPLGEVEVQVKDSSGSEGGMGAAGGADWTKMPTLWSMTLSEKTKAQDGLTLTFTDADNDGKVSQGDTLRIDAEGDYPTVVLRDTKTNTYVVPGFEALALLGAVGLLALALRRRA